MEKYPFWPKFCSDRNALPQVWQAVKDANAELEYLTILMNAANDTLPHVEVYRLNFARITAEPRVHVEAALRALDLWKPEWSAGE